MDVFRTKMLKEATIGLTPVTGYEMRNQSIVRAIWLDLEEMRRGKPIAREVRIGKFFADGADLDEKQVWEFNGCFTHGHECMFQPE
jgi:hypothetical protein